MPTGAADSARSGRCSAWGAAAPRHLRPVARAAGRAAGPRPPRSSPGKRPRLRPASGATRRLPADRFDGGRQRDARQRRATRPGDAPACARASPTRKAPRLRQAALPQVAGRARERRRTTPRPRAAAMSRVPAPAAARRSPSASTSCTGAGRSSVLVKRGAERRGTRIGDAAERRSSVRQSRLPKRRASPSRGSATACPNG